MRTLLVLAFGIAVWGSFIAKAAHRQKSAVAALLKAEIAVHYDYQHNALSMSDLTFPEGHRRRPVSLSDGAFARVQPQVSLAVLRVVTVAGKTVLRQDGPDLPGEVDLLSLPRGAEHHHR